MSKHGDVIEHNMDKLELALENNVELFYGLRFQIRQDFLYSKISRNITLQHSMALNNDQM